MKGRIQACAFTAHIATNALNFTDISPPAANTKENEPRIQDKTLSDQQTT